MSEEFDTELHPFHPYKAVIVGAGRVGTTLAYALLLNGLVGEIVLIDKDRDRAEGEAMDLNHAVPLSHPVRIWAGDYADCAHASVIVVTAGTAQREGETRLDLVKRNAAVFEEIIPQIKAHNERGILLIVTNPVDVLSHWAWQLSGWPAERVIGSGTVLDTARFRFLLGRHLGVDPRNVHAYIVGEHGDSEVALWSAASVAGMELDEFCRRAACEIDDDLRTRIFHQTRDAGYEVFRRKGATYYAIGVAVVRMMESILRDQHTILTVSSHVAGFYEMPDVYLSLPAVIGRGGVERVLHLPLNEAETTALRQSASVLRGVVDELNG